MSGVLARVGLMLGNTVGAVISDSHWVTFFAAFVAGMLTVTVVVDMLERRP